MPQGQREPGRNEQDPRFQAMKHKGIFNDLRAKRQKELQKEIRKKSPAESQEA